MVVSSDHPRERNSSAKSIRPRTLTSTQTKQCQSGPPSSETCLSPFTRLMSGDDRRQRASRLRSSSADPVGQSSGGTRLRIALHVLILTLAAADVFLYQMLYSNPRRVGGSRVDGAVSVHRLPKVSLASAPPFDCISTSTTQPRSNDTPLSQPIPTRHTSPHLRS